MIFETVINACSCSWNALLYVESWMRIDNNAIQMKLPNRTDSNIYECKSSLFLSPSREVKKCTTWTVKFVVNVLLPTHLHNIWWNLGYWGHCRKPIILLWDIYTTIVNPFGLVYRLPFRALLPEPVYNMGYLNCCWQPL